MSAPILHSTIIIIYFVSYNTECGIPLVVSFGYIQYLLFECATCDISLAFILHIIGKDKNAIAFYIGQKTKCNVFRVWRVHSDPRRTYYIYIF